MIAPARAQTTQARRLRAERILDSAAELLCRWGYNRVTIEDVAEHAQIGKGTVYLHWKTREELFYAVILRESMGMIDEFIAAVKGDAREALLHRMIRLKYACSMRRPILRAVVSADLKVLGRLASANDSNLARMQNLVSDDYYKLLFENGLVQSGFAVEDLAYGAGAVAVGFFAGDSFLTALGSDPELERKADLLEAAIERTFSAPATAEALRVMQPAVIAMLERGRDICQAYMQRAWTGDTP